MVGTKRTPKGARRAPARRNKGSDGAPLGKEDKRKQILKAAVKVFAEKGYHGCRISDVANEAGVAYGLVYHYFGNKEGLLRSIFETNWAVFAKAIEQIAGAQVPTGEKIRQIVDFLMNAFEASPLVVKVLVLEFGRSSRLGDALDDPEVNRVFSAVHSIFKEGKRRGELDAGVDPWSVTVLFLGALEAALASLVLPTPGEGGDLSRSLRGMRESLITSFTRGLVVAEGNDARARAKANARRGRRTAV